MAIPSPDVEQSDEPSADAVREHVIDRLQGGDYDSAALATLSDGEPVRVTTHVPGDDLSDAIERVEQADAAMSVVTDGPKCGDANFAVPGPQKDDRFHRLYDEAMEWAVDRREDMPDHDGDILAYTPHERAVLALGSAIQRKMNPLAGLLGALGR